MIPQLYFGDIDPLWLRIVLYIISIVFMAFLLWIFSKKLKLKEQSFRTAILVSFISILVHIAFFGLERWNIVAVVEQTVVQSLILILYDAIITSILIKIFYKEWRALWIGIAVSIISFIIYLLFSQPTVIVN